MAQMCPDPQCSRDNRDNATTCAFCHEVLRGLLGCNTILEGRYRVTGVLGCGGMGAVYLADDTRIPGRQVAVKENLNTTPEAQAQFQSEVSLMVGLKHPGLPAVSDQFMGPKGRWYLVMDYVEGETLEDIVERRGPLPEGEVTALTGQLLDILGYLHSHSIVHRDVKPSNIKLTPGGKPVLVDFGIAKVHVPGRRTQPWARGAGSPGFAPLEQYGTGTDARSDLYSLGAVMYYLLTGQAPPEAPDLAAGKRLIPPRKQRTDVSLDVQRIIFKAMALHPDQRYQSAMEMRQALRALAGPTISALPIAPPRPLVPLPPVAKPLPWIGAGGAGILAVIGLAVVALVVVMVLRNIPRGAPTPTPVAVGPITVTDTLPLGGTTAPARVTVEPTPFPATLTHTPRPTPTHQLSSPTATRRPPTDTPVAEPYALVTAETLNVRTGPGTAYESMAQVRKGNRLLIVGRNRASDWLKVRLADGKTGWVAARYVNSSVSPDRLPIEAEPPTPTPPPTPSTSMASNTRDFSGSQGARGWWYQIERGRNSGVFVDFPNFGAYQTSDGKAPRNCWLTSQEQHVRICQEGEVHPGATGRIAYRWRSDVARTVRVVVHAHKIDTSCGSNDGVWIGTYRVPQGKPPIKVGEFSIRGAEYRDRPANTYRYDIALNAGDSVMVMVDISRSTACDMTRLYVDVY